MAGAMLEQLEAERDHWRNEAERAAEAANKCIADHNELVNAYRAAKERLGEQADRIGEQADRIEELERLVKFHASKTPQSQPATETPQSQDRFSLIEMD